MKDKIYGHPKRRVPVFFCLAAGAVLILVLAIVLAVLVLLAVLILAVVLVLAAVLVIVLILVIHSSFPPR